MDQNLKILQKMEKGLQHLLLGIGPVGKPLDQIPGMIPVKDTADQIKI